MQVSEKEKRRILFCCNMLLLVAALVASFVYQLKDFSTLTKNDMGMVGDAAWYASYVDAGFFSTWHSVLLLNEIKWIGDFMGLKGLQSLWIMSCLVQVLILICSVRVSVLLYEMDKKFLWVGSIYAVSVVVCSFYYEFSMYMEHYMYGSLLLAILGVFEFFRCKSVGKYMWLLVIFFSLYHVVGFRRNAVVLLPLFFLYLIPGRWVCKTLVSRGLVALFCSAVFYLGSEYISSRVLTVNHYAYPAAPMVVSDMKISSLLREEQRAFHDILKQRCGLVCGRGEDCVGEAYVEGSLRMSSKAWNSLLSIYVDEWRNHPMEMIAARTIQAFQFYVTRRMPTWLTDFYEELYPALKRNEKTWSSAHFWRGYMLLAKELMNFLIQVGIVASLFVMWVLRTRWRQKEVLWLAAIAVIYISSFLVVIPGPYPAFRYMYPVAFIAFWVFACIGSKLIERLQES